LIGEAALDRDGAFTVLFASIAALGIGIIAAATTPLVAAAGILGLFVLAAVWWRPAFGVWLFVAIVATMPFAVIPVSLGGAQPTFVDAVMFATFTAVLARVVFGRLRLVLDAPSLAIFAFVLLAVVALFAGATVTAVTPEMLRRVAKLMASLLFFVVARALLTRPDHIASLARGLMYAGAVQGAFGAGLMLLSPLSQLTLLTRLQVLGYPTTDVLRYVPGPNDTYTNQLRAIGTSIDPNVFGGTLMLALALIVVQWASPAPVLRRSVLLMLGVPTAAGVLLSLSRASWLGLACGVLLVGALRYRRILVIGLIAGIVLLASPPGQQLILRFASGFSTSDPATAFRVGEYGNAFTLLQRYPLLGIGFGESPDIDVTAGVSSVYLLVAEQTGLLGLCVYALGLASTWWMGVRARTRTPEAKLEGLHFAFLAAFSGALATGLLDHYFANQAFPHAVALFWLYAAGLLATARLALPLAYGQRQPERTAATRAGTFRPHRSSV
jgi:hypothetical protein